MTVNGAVSPGPASRRADQLPFDVVCSRIGRQVVRDGARRIGFLSVDGPARAPDERPLVGRLVEHLAVALTGFVPRDIAIVPAWSAWPRPDPEAAAATPRKMTIRELRSRVVEVLPPGCVDGVSAARALEQTLGVLSEDFAHVLVDLTGYERLGVAPAAIATVEAAVFVATVRRARLATLRGLAEQIPKSKHLGAILIG